MKSYESAMGNFRVVFDPEATKAAAILVLLISVVMVAGLRAEERGQAKAQRSLDEALLEDLDSDLAKPPRADEPVLKDEKRTGAGKPPAKERGRNDLDDALLEGLEGEDISPRRANENPLVRLNQRMKQVERRIAETYSDDKTQRLQQEITDDLSKLIDQLEQQCRQSKNPSSSTKQQQTTSSKPATKPSEQPGEKPASDSTARTRQREASKVEGARLQEMLKDVWGHLPPHLRQQMEQSANEEFLPKYESEISEYYRALVGGRKAKK